MSIAKPRRVVITGFMCAGKTSTARILARELDCEWSDLDALIADEERCSVPELITQRGEEAFRQTESYLLQIILEAARARVIALGGGAWTIEANRTLIAAHDCFTVWLDAPFNLCWDRIALQPQMRPLALDRQSAHRLYLKRRAQYELAALRVAVTAEKNVEELAAEIIRAMRGQRFIKV